MQKSAQDADAPVSMRPLFQPEVRKRAIHVPIFVHPLTGATTAVSLTLTPLLLVRKE